ncbi:hypothetical protein VN97_g3360 [Penicillium thymicola]|uniref:Mid2 domain-containing protein n=1 Tax=Penicillium thymicola TaxID=293382 RepID=A0AAI9XBC0_PENTH|nr:hypothetical protein VN97_g3360 [Penicillium thymicola]
MCCASNRSNPAGGSSTDGLTSDECLANGLCMNVLTYRNSGGESGTNTTYWRNQCTISDWKNNGCLNVCTKGSTPSGGSDFSAKMTSCDGTANSTTWCCGDDGSCCNTPSAITIAQKLGEHTSTSTSGWISSPTSTSTSTSTSSSSSSSQLSGGVIAGIAVGSVLGAIAFLAIIYFSLVRWKKKRIQRENEAEGLAITLRPGSRPQELENHIQTIGVRSVAHEKATGPQDIRAELPSEPVGRTVN